MSFYPRISLSRKENTLSQKNARNNKVTANFEIIISNELDIAVKENSVSVAYSKQLI
jgi:hypothetical protein